MGRTPLLSALPGRIIREVPEVPFAIYCAMLLTSVVVSRCGLCFIFSARTTQPLCRSPVCYHASQPPHHQPQCPPRLPGCAPNGLYGVDTSSPEGSEGY